MTPFYRDYLMREGRYSKEKATFADFKSSYRETKYTPDQQVVELKRYATLELMLRRPRLVKNEALQRMLCQVEGMDITTSYAFILNLLDRNQQGKLGDDELCGCLQDLVSFVLRRSLCSESTRPYNRWFVEAIGVLRDNPRQDLEKYWLSRRWPDDAAVRQRIVDFALYRREGAKARVMLEAIEEAYGHKEKVNLNDPKIQVEHVLPQTISNNAAGRSWKAMLGENWEEMQEKYIHTLGNLTLTGYNPDLSNSSFDKKKELLQESHLELNKHFTELQAWNADTIVARSKKLAEEIIRLWPRPVGAYAASAEAMPEPEEYSTGEKKRLEYWRHFHVRLEERVMEPEIVIPGPNPSITIATSKTGYAEIEVGMYQQHNSIYVSLLLYGDLGDFVAERLEKEKASIEAELTYQLQWDVKEGYADIYIKDSGVQVWDKEDWTVQHDWLGDKLEDFLRVLKPRVEMLEQEAMADPVIRHEVESYHQFVEYWKACAKDMQGAATQVRESELERGRKTCSFEKIETGIFFAAQCYPDEGAVYVSFGVLDSAGRKLRSRFTDLHNREVAALELELGEKLTWNDYYVWATLPAKPEDKADWPRQHKWIRQTAEKFLSVFKSRLDLE